MPVWGEWHTRIFKEHVFPNHKKLGLEGCTYIVHTDNPHNLDFVNDLGCEIVFGVRQSNGYKGMNYCHTEAIKIARGGGIMFLPPDCVVSTNTFQKVKESGKKLVMCASLRTFGGIPPDHDPEVLNSWAVDHLHHNIKGWIWGNKTGTSVIPSNIYFRDGGNFWCHGAHLHPLAAVLDRKTGGGKSIDSYLAGAYSEDETWVVSDCEIAMAEITPPEKFAGLDEAPISVHSCVKRLTGKLHEHNKRFMLKPIRLKGRAGVTDVPSQILKGLP